MRQQFTMAVRGLFLVCAVLLILVSPLAQAADGDFVFAKGFGGTGAELARAVTRDSSGNIYLTGAFRDTADFDPDAVGVFNLTSASAGVNDIFVCKLDSAGVFVWAVAMGGALLDQGNAIAVDGSGNVYVTGQYRSDPATFGAFPLANSTVGGGFDDVFIVNLNSAGTVVWANKIGGTGNDVGMGITLNASNDIFIAGSFSGVNVDFNPGVANNLLSSLGGTDIFVCRWTNAPVYTWAVRMGTSGANNDQATAITLDGSNNVYTTGFFNAAGAVIVDFDPGAGTQSLTNAGGSDIFISKLSSAGAYVFAKGMGGAGADVGRGIGRDSVGHIYTVGDFNGTADFNPDAVGVANLTSAGLADVFVSKLDSAGLYVWAKGLGGAGAELGNSIAVESNDGHVYTTGSFSGLTADFDPDAVGVANLVSLGGTDVFVSKLLWDGTYTWAKAVGGTGADVGTSVVVDSSSFVYGVGSFTGTVDFDPNAGVSNLVSFGLTDAYLLKLDGLTAFPPDLIPPTVTQFDAAVTEPTNSTNVDFALTFSENVLNTDVTDFSFNLLSGVLSFSSFSIFEAAGIYTLSVLGLSGTGDFQVDFAGTTNIVDGGANALVPTSSEAISVDTDPPSVVLSGPASGCAPFTLTVTFNEAVTGFTSGDLLLSNATAGAASGGPAVYTVPITATGAAATVDLAAGNAIDTAGNGNTVAAQFSYAATDFTAPTVVLSGPASGCAAFTLTVTFSEAVTGFDETDLVISNATAGTAVGGPSAYTVPMTATGSTVTVDMSAGAAQDACLINSTAALAYTYTADLSAPSVALSGAASGCAAGIVTAVFSEPVTGVLAGDFVLTNATAGTFTAISTTVYTLAFTATAAAVTVNMAAGAATDGCNTSTAAAQYNYAADFAAPTVVLSYPGGTMAGAFTLTVTFNEAVSGLLASEISASVGTLGSLGGGPNAYTITVTPPGGSGNININLPAGAAQDACGNNNTAATQLVVPYNVGVDPTVLLSGATSGCAANTVTATFSEPVTDMTGPEFVFTNATAGTFTAVSTTVYTMTYTATAVAVTVDVPAGAATSISTSFPNLAAVTFNYTADLTSPSVVLSGAVSGCAAGLVTATFSEAVTGVLAGDFVLANATSGTFTAVSTTVYTLTFTATGAAVTVNMAAGAATDSCNTSTAAAQYNYSADLSVPSVVLSGAANGCAAGLVTATFSEAVTGVLAGDFVLTNATAGTFTAVSTTVYTLAFTSTSAAVTVDMAAGAATDGCNTSTAAATYNYTADLTAPSVVLSGAASGCAAGLVTATFSEAVTGVLAGDFVLANATAGTFTAVSTTVYTLSFTATASAVTVNMAAGAATDSCNTSTAAAQYSYTADVSGPTVILSGAASGCAAGTVTATFSEPVTGVLTGDFVVVGATKNVFTAVSTTVYTQTFTATAGAVTVNMAAGAATDSCNTSTAAAQYNYTADLTAPSVVLSGAASGCAAGLVTATFSEAVTGVLAGDFSLSNATAGTFTAVSTTVYTLAFTATASAVTVNMAAGAATDSCNTSTAAAPYSYTADLTAPTVVLSGAASGCAAGTVTATFSEPVTGILTGDFVVVGATKNVFTAVSTTVYTQTFTATAGTVTVNMAAGAAIDACSNSSTAAVQYSYTADLTAPSVVLSGAASGCAAGLVTATFSEAVTGVLTGDFVLTNATSGTFTAVSTSVYTLAFTSTASAVTVNMAAAAATDGCNTSAAAAQYNYTADFIAPSVVLSYPGGTVTGAFTLTVTFDESVSGLLASEISASVGTLGSLSGGPSVYTISVTPPAGAGNINLDLPANAAQDACGNNNTAATQLVVPYIVGTNPTVVLSGATSGCAANTVTATFNEPVNNMAAGDFVFANATAGTFTAVSTTVYTMTFTATAAAVTVDVPAGAANSISTTLPSFASATFNYTADLTAPTVVLSGAASGCAAGLVTATFNEAVSGVLAGDFVLANATAGTFTAVSTTVYTLAFTSTASAVTVNMAAGAATDGCNTSTAAAQHNYTADITAPSVVLSGAANGCAAGLVTATFSEAVTGVLAGDFVLANATAGTFTAVSTTVYTLAFISTATAVTVDMAAGAATDGCNGSTAATQYNYTADVTAPNVVLSGAAGGCAAGLVTATFSEAVTGVLAGDFVLTNATAGTFTAVSTTVYTLAFTSTATAVTVNMGAGAATDGCNSSTVATAYNYTADITAPTVALSGAVTGCAAGLVTATFSEAVTGVLAGDFVLANATAGTFTAVSTTVYTLAFTATAAAVTVNMAAGAATDSCNSSTAAAQYNYTADLIAPTVTLSGAASGCAAGLVTATFSEAVTGVLAGDFVLANATAGTFTAVSTTVYTLAFTSTASAVTVDMAAGAATDSCNTSTAAAQYNYTADLTAPNVVLSGAVSGCAAGLVTATFSEPVTGVLAGDFALTNATSGAFTAVSTTVYTLAFTATATAVTVNMAAGAATDGCNGSTAAAQYNYTADVTAPTVVLSGAASGCAAGTVTATFSEPVTGVLTADFVVVGATKNVFTAVSTTVYTQTFTATAGAVTVNMAAGAATDSCNSSTAAAQYNYTADLIAPTVVLSGAASGCAAGTVTATFNEAVTGVLAGDFVLANATAGTFTAVSATVYTLAFTATASAVTVNMAAGAATDGCNTSTAAAQYNYTADVSAPTVILSGAASGCAAGMVTATFSEPVTGVLTGDFVVVGATKNVFTAVSTTVYTQTFTATAGAVTVNMPAAAATDSCNTSTAAAQYNYAADLTAPSVVLSGAASGCASGLVTATFSEPVTGVLTGDFVFTNATGGAFTAVSTTVYTRAFTATASPVTVNMAAGAATDGCNNSTAAAPYNYVVDLTPPSVVLSGAASGCATGLVTATFDKVVTGVTAGDFILTNATAGTFTPVSTTVYTLTFTATAAVVTVNMGAGAAVDACSIGNSAAAPYNYSSDFTTPSVVLSGVASGCAAGTVTATFSEPVTGVLAGDFVLTNATAGTFTAVSTTVYTLTFTATAASSTVNMAASAAIDTCGNNSTAAAPYNYTSDLTPPSVVLSGPASGCAAGLVTATFSEPVSGVLAGDFIFTNATGGVFTAVSSTVYTRAFTATSSAVTVNMPAGAAIDSCNTNTAAAPYSYSADFTNPSVVLSGAATGCAAGLVTATFSEAVTGVIAGDFVLGNATAGTFTAVSTTVYTLAFTATASAVTVNMAASAAQDLCGRNSNAAAQYNYAVDLAGPTVVLSGAASGCAAGLVTATFNEPVVGVLAADFVLTNATAGAFTVVSSTVYTLAFTATGSAVTVNMAAGAAQDASCGNNSVVAATYNYTADLTNPTVVLSGGASGCAAGLVTATFSEAVTNVLAGDFVLTNATSGTFTAVSTTVYTLSFTATAAAVTVNMAAGAAQDVCSRNSTAAAPYNYALETTPPTVLTQNITVQLNAAGNVSIVPTDVDNGSSDACGIASRSLDVSSFTCANVGANSVVLTVTDNNGNSNTGTATVTVEDNVAPTVITQNPTVQLNAAGTVTVGQALVNNGSSDACGIASRIVIPSFFTCANVGPNNVMLMVTDVNGNVNSGPAVVTVQDNIDPVVVTQNITVQLNAAGNVSITPAMVNNGSSDACGIASLSLNISAFTGADLGPNSVTLTVTDNNGNLNTGVATVTVQDIIDPTFTNLIANPSNATDTNLVTITFTASEPLFGPPDVLVNGTLANFVSASALNYTYSYLVTGADPIGSATIQIDGFDLANNAGQLVNTTALTIYSTTNSVPLVAWPGIIALAAAGALVLRRRKS